MKVLVIGSGAWGTTLAQLLARSGSSVTIACHQDSIIQEIRTQRTNTRYLPDKPRLDSTIQAIDLAGIEEIRQAADLLVVAVASPYYRAILQRIAGSLQPQQLIVSATKGMEDQTNKSLLDVAKEALPLEAFKRQFALLTGPNLAGEIYQGKPAATVIAALSNDTARKVQKLFSSSLFRAYTTDDMKGASYGGILKNIIAIAAGCVDAREFGANAKAALLIRGMAEMRRYAMVQGAREETLNGLSGFGDLITTCMGPASRNYSVGFRLGKGESLEAIVKSMNSIAEGINTCKVIYRNAQLQRIPMPVTEALHQALFQGVAIDVLIEQLMTRDLKKED
jgi:glycerol-3-phosphate dehydrogenase (NAD(P)+)